MAGRCIELSIRSLAMAAGLGAGVAGGFAINQLLVILREVDPQTGEQLQNVIQQAMANNSDVILYTNVCSGLAISFALVGLFVAVAIFMRICKCCDMGPTGKFFYSLDIIVVLLCIVGFGAGGVIGAFGANTWSNLLSEHPPSLDDYVNLIDQIRSKLAATAAVSLLAFFSYDILILWMIAFTIRNRKTLEYEGCI